MFYFLSINRLIILSHLFISIILHIYPQLMRNCTHFKKWEKKCTHLKHKSGCEKMDVKIWVYFVNKYMRMLV